MIISVNKISKNFIIKEKKGILKREKKIIRAVDNISFEINKGEIVGYIGVNGAGKSTTIKMLTGILTPTTGTIKVFNKEPHEFRSLISKEIGVVFGQRSQLLWDLPVIDTFNLFSKIYEIPIHIYKTRLKELVNYVGIDNLLNIPVRKLSLGQRMCCEIVASLLHNPKILFLDEPTIGLDIINKEKIRKLIRLINEKFGTTVILTTHDLYEIEQLCNRVIIIDKGKKIYDGTLMKLRNLYGGFTTVKVELLSELENLNYLVEKIIELCEYNVILDKNSIIIKYNNKFHNSADVLSFIIKNISSIKDIHIIETSIEDIIKQIYMNQINLEGKLEDI